MQPRPVRRRDRFKELDVLRGLAALGVVLFHYSGHATRYFGDFPFVFAYGDRGVQLFFMISGFVIYFTLERSRTWYDFAVSRIARLYPVYWSAIAIGTAATWIAADEPIWWGGVVVNLTMLQSFVGYPDLDLVFWTLAVELTFYVLMGLLFIAGVLGRIEWVAAGWPPWRCSGPSAGRAWGPRTVSWARH